MTESQHSARFPPLRRGLIAILRGLPPDDAEAVGAALVEAGFEAIEVPMNSPRPLVSVERLVKRFGDVAMIGAGTVLTAAEVHAVAMAGGRLIVAPNLDAEVLSATAERRMVSMPGVFSPTEALSALRRGASALKFFPAVGMGAAGIGAIRAILPQQTLVGAVGGVTEADFPSYWAAGTRLFGLGSSLYKPGEKPAEVAAKARAIVTAYDTLQAAEVG